MKDHLSPVGKPAPPRPRNPDSFTMSVTRTGSMARACSSAAYPPRFTHPLYVRASASPKYRERRTVSLGCGLWGKPITAPWGKRGTLGNAEVRTRNAEQACQRREPSDPRRPFRVSRSAFRVRISLVLPHELRNLVRRDGLDEVVVHQYRRRKPARAEALHLDDGPLAVRARGAELLGPGRREQRLDHRLGAADVTGRRGAHLHEVPADGMLVVHRVERDDALHVRGRQSQHLGDFRHVAIG